MTVSVISCIYWFKAVFLTLIKKQKEVESRG
jgi:hypothetical protein